MAKESMSMNKVLIESEEWTDYDAGFRWMYGVILQEVRAHYRGPDAGSCICLPCAVLQGTKRGVAMLAAWNPTDNFAEGRKRLCQSIVTEAMEGADFLTCTCDACDVRLKIWLADLEGRNRGPCKCEECQKYGQYPFETARDTGWVSLGELLAPLKEWYENGQRG